MFSITRKDGTFRALCRPCELTRGWPHGSACERPTIDDLDFERFMSIIESEHAFDRKSDSLGWRGEGSGSSEEQSMIDNDRQWKTVMAHLVRQGKPLKFMIVENGRCG